MLLLLDRVMSKTLADQDRVATLDAEEQALAKQLAHLKRISKEQDETIESLKKQIADNDEVLMKLHNVYKQLCL